MTQYLISFPVDAMDHIPEEDMAEVGKAAHAVISDAKAAGVFVFAGGLEIDVAPVVVSDDGTSEPGSYPGTREPGGMTIVDVSSPEEAAVWAARIAAACRCPQEVRPFQYDGFSETDDGAPTA